jgi:hypothetical protein
MDIQLLDLMDGQTHIFGSTNGVDAREKLVKRLDEQPNTQVMRIHLDGITVVDAVFVRESIAAVAKMYRGRIIVIVILAEDRIYSNWIGGSKNARCNFNFQVQ